jgi:hypothetical protein
MTSRAIPLFSYAYYRRGGSEFWYFTVPIRLVALLSFLLYYARYTKRARHAGLIHGPIDYHGVIKTIFHSHIM